jgi:predicted transcriptional regulator
VAGAQIREAKQVAGRVISPEELARELFEQAREHEEWFCREVDQGLAQLGRGEYLEHDEVVARIERGLRI